MPRAVRYEVGRGASESDASGRMTAETGHATPRGSPQVSNRPRSPSCCLAVLLVLTFGTACADTPSLASPSGLFLADGRPLPVLLATADTVVILVYAPADCLTCGATVANWLEWQQGVPSRAVYLVLDRVPDPAARTEILRQRIQPSFYLANAQHSTPIILVGVGTEPADSAVGVAASSALFERWVIASREQP